MYSPATVLLYARARRRGTPLPAPVEDIRQLGGDAVAVDGALVRRWRPRTPTDRVTPAVLVAAAVIAR